MDRRFSLHVLARCAAVLAFSLTTFFSQRLCAHPISQGSLDVTIYADRVAVRARVTVEEVLVTNRLTTPGATPDPFGAADSAAYEQHAAYLASHLHVTLDGKPLPGGVDKVDPPDSSRPGPSEMATYELHYPITPANPKPHQIELRSDVLAEIDSAPAMKWESSYVVRISAPGRTLAEGLLLTSSQPIDASVDLSPRSAAAQQASSPTSRWTIFSEYFFHGIHHIFSLADPGYDHLLFVSALVLGARTLWELFKLVTAFTLAHTITLTLAALKLVHVDERIVEPLIALSIVFVAIENVVFPRRSHGWLRLGVAFFFGLFHGLGFAGGLLAAMQGMNGSIVLVAILAFSIGVETAHQMVVIPLFALVKLLRCTRADDRSKQMISLVIQRYGSVAISLAGIFYLFLALRPSFTGE